MTKKDYALIANTIKEIRARKARGNRIADIFAEALLRSNSNFDAINFLSACGDDDTNEFLKKLHN